jgi:hypothetical protein
LATFYHGDPESWAVGVRPFAESAFPQEEIFCARLDRLLPGHALVNGASGQGKSTLLLTLAFLALTSGWAVWIFTLKPTNLFFNWAWSLPSALCRRLQFLSLFRPHAAGMRCYAALADIMRDAKGDKRVFGRILGKNLIATAGYERQYALRSWVGGPVADLEHNCEHASGAGPHGIDLNDVMRQIDSRRLGSNDLERALEGFQANDILHPERCPGMDVLDVDAALESQSLTIVEMNHADDPVRSLDTFNLLTDSILRKRKALGLAGSTQHVFGLVDESAPAVIDSPHLSDWATCRMPARVRWVFASQGIESQTKPRKGMSGGSVLRDVCDTIIEFTPAPDKIRDMLARAGEHWQQMTSVSVTDHGLSSCVSESSRWDRFPAINPDLLIWASSTPNWAIVQCPTVPLLVCRPLFATTAEEFDDFEDTPLPERPPPDEAPVTPEPPPEPPSSQPEQRKPRRIGGATDIDPDEIHEFGEEVRKRNKRWKGRGKRRS